MKKKGTVLIAFGFVFILASAGLLAYNIIEEKNAERFSEKAAVFLEEKIVVKKDNAENENSSEAEIPDYILNPEMDMPVLESEGISYIGTLDIPRIGLVLPIISEWSYPNLKIAPCRYFGSAYLDNMVIAGHNYRSHFKELENLFIGDEIIFRDTDGNEFYYNVSAREVLPPTAIEEMTSGEWDLTLFTCNPAGTFRVAIRCDRTE